MLEILTKMPAKRSAVIAGAVALGLLAIATWVLFFQSSEEPSTPVLLLGSGATFPMEQVKAWASQVSKVHPWLQVEYAGGGTGKGQNDFLLGIVDFACSDVPLKAADWEKAKAQFGGVYQLPMILGGVAVVYNIPEVPPDVNLRLTAEVLADILLGKIEYWDDPRIRELNPEVSLPRARIVFVHRSDASGTTEVFTTFLSTYSAEWREAVGAGKTVKWPLDELGRGVGAPGNPGVAQAVKTTPYSLGYVELAYAKGLGVAAIRNRAGRFVLPSADSIRVAAAGAVSITDAGANLADLRILESILSSSSPEAYPIASPSYLLVKSPSAYPPEKRKAIAAFLEFVFSRGQSSENIVEGYVPIPESWRQLGLQAASKFKE